MARRAEPVQLRGDGTIGVTSERPPSLAELFLSTLKPAWHADAACREFPSLSWFPERGESSAGAKNVCRRCLVQAECAEAGEREAVGIWGGLSAQERRQRRSSRSEPDADAA